MLPLIWIAGWQLSSIEGESFESMSATIPHLGPRPLFSTLLSVVVAFSLGVSLPDSAQARSSSAGKGKTTTASSSTKRTSTVKKSTAPTRSPPRVAKSKNTPRTRVAKSLIAPAAAVGAAGAVASNVAAAAPTESVSVAPKKPSPPRQEWSGTLPELAARYRMNPNSVGYLVYDLDHNKVLESWQDHTTFIPASVTKVPTAIAGLAILGADHRFDTTVWGTGFLQENTHTLNGDLYLKGGGDPGLQIGNLQQLARLLKETGIKKISGRFLYDTSLYVEVPQIDPIQPEDVGYNPGVGALSVSYNRMSLFWNSPRGSAQFTPAPPITGVRVNPEGTANKPKTLFVYEDQNGEDYWQTTRRISGSGGLSLPVKRAGRYTARLFATLAKNEGIQLPDPVPNPAMVPKEATMLAVHYGNTLMDLTRETLKHSNNMMAEMIGLATAHKLSGKAQPLSEASAQVRQWWRQQAPGVDWQGFEIPNFSGLSSAGRITPQQMVEILRIANGPENNHETFLNRLPISPWRSGIMAKESGRSRTQVWVKTGTMYFGRALTGVIVTPERRRLAFAIFNTDMDKRQALDSRMFGDSEDVETKVKVPSDTENKSWLARAKTLERALVTRWAMNY